MWPPLSLSTATGPHAPRMMVRGAMVTRRSVTRVALQLLPSVFAQWPDAGLTARPHGVSGRVDARVRLPLVRQDSAPLDPSVQVLDVLPDRQQCVYLVLAVMSHVRFDGLVDGLPEQTQRLIGVHCGLLSPCRPRQGHTPRCV